MQLSHGLANDKELGKPEQDPIVIYEDNQGAIAAALYQKTN